VVQIHPNSRWSALHCKLFRASSLSKSVTANSNYWIEWDNAWDSSRFNFTLAFTPRATVAGESCASSLLLPLATTHIDSFTGYSPSHIDARKAIWYRFSPQIDGKLSIISCNGGADTRVWIYKGLCQSLALQASADNTCPLNGTDTQNKAASIVNFPLIAGSNYFVEWDNANSSTAFDFTAQFSFINGVEEQIGLENRVKIYPNPVFNTLNLDFNLPIQTPVEMSIVNTLGLQIHHQTIGVVQTTSVGIDIPNSIVSGVYFVQIKTPLASFTKRIIISR
jgi:hypothetical protein